MVSHITEVMLYEWEMLREIDIFFSAKYYLNIQLYIKVYF